MRGHIQRVLLKYPPFAQCNGLGNHPLRCAAFHIKDENGWRRSDTDETTLLLSPCSLLAVAAIDGVVIGHGEYFSFCHLVGRPTRKRGYVEGMELSFDEARSDVGGGICQLSNLIHWIAIHSPLVVVERSNYSYDLFPDEGRRRVGCWRTSGFSESVVVK